MSIYLERVEGAGRKSRRKPERKGPQKQTTINVPNGNKPSSSGPAIPGFPAAPPAPQAGKKPPKKGKPQEVDGPEEKVDDGNKTYKRITSLENPAFFIASAKNEVAAWGDFKKKAGDFLKQGQLIFAPNSGNFKNVFGYFIPGNIANTIMKAASLSNLQACGVTPITADFFNEEQPFSKLELPAPVLAIHDREGLANALNVQWGQFKSNLDLGDALEAVQLASAVPLNYYRFFNVKNRPYEFYLGGFPSNAGVRGFTYPLVEDTEAKVFVQFIRDFKPPRLFTRNFSILNDIDADFKAFSPRKFQPANAILLIAKTKFTPKAQMTVDGKNGKQYEFLSAWAHQHGGLASPGTYSEGKAVIGNASVNFSQDMKHAILWCGHKPVTISEEEKQTYMKIFPFLSGINMHFAH